MASGYGSVTSNSRLKWQIDMSPSAVSAGTSQVNLRVRVWYCTVNGWSINSSSNSLTFTGSISGTVAVSNLNVGKNAGVLIYDRTVQRSPQYGSATSFSFTARMSGVVYDMNPSCTGSLSIPARPYSVPANATGVSATYISDTQARVSYTASTSTGAPATGVQIQGETNKSGSWYNVATVAGTGSRNYTVTGLSKGRVYRWRIRPYGTAGNASGWTYTGYVYTTPTPVSSLTAVKHSESSIKATWTQATYTGGNNVYTRVYLDGSWVFTADPGVTSYTIPNVSGGAHTVEVAPLCAGREGAHVSRTVQMSSTAAVPTILSPVSGHIDATKPISLVWKHNPTDGSAQSQAVVQLSDGSSWTDYQTITGTTQSLVVPAGDIPNPQVGGTWLWRVATAGANGVLSGYTPSGQIINDNPSTTSISTPDLVESASVQIDLSISDLGCVGFTGTGLYRWRLENLTRDQVVRDYGTPEQYGLGNTSQVTYRGLENNCAYRVSAYSTLFIDGTVSSTDFTVSYRAPLEPSLSQLSFNVDEGSLEFYVSPIPGSGDTPVSLSVEVFDGMEWHLAYSTTEVEGWCVLPSLPLGERAVIRAVYTSSLGALSYSAPVFHDIPAVAAYISSSSGETLRIDRGLVVSVTPQLPGASLEYPLGSVYPVSFDTGVRGRIFDLKFSLGRENYPDDPIGARGLLENTFILRDYVTLRLPTYGVVPCVISGFSYERDRLGNYSCNMTCEEVEG